MFRYQWFTTALDKLADIYVNADSEEREQIADGVEAFNAQLASDPLGLGESREYEFRVAFPPLLAVYFWVDIPTREVRVMNLLRYGK